MYTISNMVVAVALRHGFCPSSLIVGVRVQLGKAFFTNRPIVALFPAGGIVPMLATQVLTRWLGVGDVFRQVVEAVH